MKPCLVVGVPYNPISSIVLEKRETPTTAPESVVGKHKSEIENQNPATYAVVRVPGNLSPSPPLVFPTT